MTFGIGEVALEFQGFSWVEHVEEMRQSSKEPNGEEKENQSGLAASALNSSL